ncbi:hypothetical protein KOI35_09090 [Actinoplanes bogorensis]|uniref:N-acetyltransferase domain-containing protein n=1 Tax=Paractinoplanes bogorensis TaxID=1610840 RepID=A0ABS5YNT6_9ACTN|nr:hypothetical protein [Actinoplanes bogorensis]MBU2663660.1 hypothetical protein [Actinoplanes bogorensis]
MELIPAGALSAGQLAATEAIYLARFPAGLRAPFDDLLADDVLVLIDDDGPAGFAVTRPLGPTGWVFLRYFAVLRRGAGAGSTMWRLACANWAAAGHPRVLLDVEDPDEPGIDAAEESERRRRIVFYERLGARVLPVSDYEPPQPGGHPEPLRLLAASTGLESDEASVRDQVLAVYQYRYGLGPDDPAVRKALLTL